jgi:hypothetical protein
MSGRNDSVLKQRRKRLHEFCSQRHTRLLDAHRGSRCDLAKAAALPVYCAQTVPTIFTAYRRGPSATSAFVQVRGTLSLRTIGDCSAGILPGLQTSPSASGV